MHIAGLRSSFEQVHGSDTRGRLPREILLGCSDVLALRRQARGMLDTGTLRQRSIDSPSPRKTDSLDRDIFDEYRYKESMCDSIP